MKREYFILNLKMMQEASKRRYNKIKLLSLSFVSKLIILLLKLYIKLIEAFNSMFINWEVVNNSSNELVCVSKLTDANLVGIFICISIGIPNELISSYIGYPVSN